VVATIIGLLNEVYAVAIFVHRVAYIWSQLHLRLKQTSWSITLCVIDFLRQSFDCCIWIFYGTSRCNICTLVSYAIDFVDRYRFWQWL